MAIKDCSNAIQFAADHGISEEVWRCRPYVRWTPQDLSGLDAEFGHDFSLREKVSRVVVAPTAAGDEEFGHNGCGWVMHRYAADPADLPHVYAEIRPDNAVELRPARSHFHGEVDEFPYEILEYRQGIMGAQSWIQYKCPEGSDRASRWIPYYKPRSFSMVGNHEIAGGHINRAKDKGQDNHAGINSVVIHSHVEEAKYLFKGSEKVDRVWSHSHDEDHFADNHDALAGHIGKRHRGCSEDEMVGPHEHSDRVKDPDRNYAARIDVHPMAAERLVDADVIYFALEGCIKADALLTAIIREGRNASVISVPSVSLWDCPELALVCSRFLMGKTVVIVVDADGVDNARVVNQASICQSMLFKLGVGRVFVTAPALDVNGQILVDPVIGKLKGVDDFLAAGYKLGDLAVSTAIPPMYEVRVLVRSMTKHVDTREDWIQSVSAFSRYAGVTGFIQAPQSMVARVLGVDQRTVSRLIHRLAEAGAVQVWADGGLQRSGKITSRQDWRGQTDWEERPFLLLSENLRATVLRCSLSDVL